MDTTTASQTTIPYFEGCTLCFRYTDRDLQAASCLINDKPQTFKDHRAALRAIVLAGPSMTRSKINKLVNIAMCPLDLPWAYALYVLADNVIYLTDYRVPTDAIESLLDTFTLETVPTRYYIEMLRFIKCDIWRIFDNAADNDSLLKQVTKHQHRLLIDPHMCSLSRYDSPQPCTAYTFEGLSYSEAVCLDRYHAIELFHKTTDNIFLDSTFPRANAWFIGGFIEKCLTGKIEQHYASDVDIFIIGKDYDSKKQAVSDVIHWFINKFGSRVYFTLRGSVCNIYIVDFTRKIQIITNNCTDVYSIISKFDLSHIAWAFDLEKFVGLPESVETIQTRQTIPMNLMRAMAVRFIKALDCGYSIRKDDRILTQGVDLEQLLASEETIFSYLKEISASWHPTSGGVCKMMTPTQLKLHTLSMCEKDAPGHYATTDPAVVLDKITVGGNFEEDYISNPFTNFSILTIVGQGNFARSVTTLSNSFGVIKLLSDEMKVISLDETQEGHLELTMEISSVFATFCNMLDDKVYKMFVRQGKQKTRLVNDNKIMIMITKNILDAQVDSGKSILRSKEGKKLNISEDLKVGDMVKLFFKIVIFRSTQMICFKPLSITNFGKAKD